MLGSLLVRLTRFASALLGLLKESVTRWVDDGCMRLAASFAFYALFSVFPLLLVLTTVFGFFLGGDDAIRQHLLSSVSQISSTEYRALLEQTLDSLHEHQRARGIGAAIGFAALVFSASSAFSELGFALNVIWRAKPHPAGMGMWTSIRNAVREKALSFVAVAGTALALIVSLLLSTGLSLLSAHAPGGAGFLLWRLVESLAAIVLLSALFSAIFKLLPETFVAWSDVLGGALLTALIFTALRGLLAWYLGSIGGYSAYGAVGALLGFATWIYLASLFLFFGAEFTRVYAERFGSVRRLTSPAS